MIHLGTNFEPHESRKAAPKKDRPASSHSLKTLPRTGKGQPSPLGKNRGGDEEDDGGSEGDGSRFQTMASYRTAREGEGSEELAGESRKGGKKVDGKRALGEVFSPDEGGPSPQKEDHEAVSFGVSSPVAARADRGTSPQLAKALKKLVDSMDTFKLEPVGPIVADLSEGAPSK